MKLLLIFIFSTSLLQASDISNTYFDFFLETQKCTTEGRKNEAELETVVTTMSGHYSEDKEQFSFEIVSHKMSEPNIKLSARKVFTISGDKITSKYEDALGNKTIGSFESIGDAKFKEKASFPTGLWFETLHEFSGDRFYSETIYYSKENEILARAKTTYESQVAKKVEQIRGDNR